MRGLEVVEVEVEVLAIVVDEEPNVKELAPAADAGSGGLGFGVERGVCDD